MSSSIRRRRQRKFMSNQDDLHIEKPQKAEYEQLQGSSILDESSPTKIDLQAKADMMFTAHRIKEHKIIQLEQQEDDDDDNFKQKKNNFEDSDEDDENEYKNKDKYENQKQKLQVERKEKKQIENQQQKKGRKKKNPMFAQQFIEEQNQEEIEDQDEQKDEEQKQQKQDSLSDSSQQGNIPKNKSKRKNQTEQIEQIQYNDREEVMVSNMMSKIVKNEKNCHVRIDKMISEANYDKDQRKRIIYEPLKPGQSSFCTFRRFSKGLSQYFQIIGEDQRPIMFSQNQRGCIGCNYYISLTKQMDKKNPAFIGKLRGNASGALYQLYDNGEQPNKSIDRRDWRISMASIEYETNIMGLSGPRKLKVTLPNLQDSKDYELYKLSESESLQKFSGNSVVSLRNKLPKWNPKIQSYSLNFGGKVKEASIKNFILIDNSVSYEEEHLGQKILTFGKVNDQNFSLEWKSPLSLFQAFGIVLSEFDYKILCE